jgi:hypothetical protein
LRNRGRPVDVCGNHEHFLLRTLAQQLAQLAGGGGLAGALQAGHENHRWRLDGKVQPGVRPAHQLRQLLVHDPDQRLTRRQRARHFLTDRPFLDPGDEVLDHRQGHVRLQQGEADFPHHFLNVFFCEPGLATNGLYDLGEPLREVV